jgi:hypothetical protein
VSLCTAKTLNGKAWCVTGIVDGRQASDACYTEGCTVGQFKLHRTCAPCSNSCLTCTQTAETCVATCKTYQRRSNTECLNFCSAEDAFINLTTESCETCPSIMTYDPTGCKIGETHTYCEFKLENQAEFPWPCKCADKLVPNPVTNRCDVPPPLRLLFTFGAAAPDAKVGTAGCQNVFISNGVTLTGRHRNDELLPA